MSQPIKLPRKALRYTAFSRYEPYIARGCRETYILNPFELPKHVKPASFVTGFNEAKLGFKTYDHPSTLIPPGYDIDRVRAFETEGGQILIENAYEDKQRQRAAVTQAMSVTMKNGAIASINSKDKPEKHIVIRDNDDLAKICQAITDSTVDGFATLVLVAPNVDTTRLAGQWPSVDVEKLNEGFVRIR